MQHNTSQQFRLHRSYRSGSLRASPAVSQFLATSFISPFGDERPERGQDFVHPRLKHLGFLAALL